jgi:hypothetical protein
MKASEPKKKCPCVHYESESDDPYDSCTCGHAPEEHEKNGCIREVWDEEKQVDQREVYHTLPDAEKP